MLRGSVACVSAVTPMRKSVSLISSVRSDALRTLIELMRSCGFTYAECEAEGIMLPVVHAEVDYRAPAHYDDVLELTSWVKELRGVRIEIACEVRRKGEDRVLASGFTRHCFVSSSTFRPVPPPERLVAAIG